MSNPLSSESYAPTASMLDPWGTAPAPESPEIDSPPSPPHYDPESAFPSTSTEHTPDLPRAHVQVKQRAETGGSLLTTHTIYFVKSSSSIVVERRYSDFRSLAVLLLKLYPFRLHPALPPKKLLKLFQLQQTAFLASRRRGLEHWLEAIVNHPVLSQDKFLAVFLTGRTDFREWVRKSEESVVEEAFTIPGGPGERELAQVPKDLEQKLEQLRTRVKPIIGAYASILASYESVLAARQSQAVEYSLMSDQIKDVIAIERGGWRSGLTAHVEELGLRWGEYCGREAGVLAKGAKEEEDDFVKELTRHLALYQSMQSLFARHQILSLDPIPTLSSHIASSNVKLSTLRSSPLAPTPKSLATIAELQGSIEADKAQIEKWTQRRASVRYCMWTEMREMFKGTTLIQYGYEALAKAERERGERSVANAVHFESDLGV